MPPRKRKAENAWMKDYPGLHVYDDGRFFVIHPVTKNRASLGTREKDAALALYARLKAKWEPEKINAVATAVLERLDAIEVHKGERTTFREFARRWRENILGFLVDDDGIVTRLPTKITKKGGKAIDTRTQTDYGRQCRQMEKSELSGFYLTDKDALRKTRLMLAPWADKPRHYNHLLAVVNHIYRAAIVEGLIVANPAREIEKLGTSKREVYIPDDHYLSITDVIAKHVLRGKQQDGEWRAKICDMLYMMSSRPGDAFKIKEKGLRMPDVPWAALNSGLLKDEAVDFGSFTFDVSKTKMGQVIDMNRDMRELVDWFIAFKRKHHIFSQALLCYPPYMRRVAGKPVSHKYMQGEWAQAVTDAGFAHSQYWLVDLRKKGLTDEFVSQGENDKGTHRTQEMRNYYRLVQPPKRAKNTLVDIRKAGGAK